MTPTEKILRRKNETRTKKETKTTVGSVIVVRSREALWLQREVGTAWFGSMAAGYSSLFRPRPMLVFESLSAFIIKKKGKRPAFDLGRLPSQPQAIKNSKLLTRSSKRASG